MLLSTFQTLYSVVSLGFITSKSLVSEKVWFFDEGRILFRQLFVFIHQAFGLFDVIHGMKVSSSYLEPSGTFFPYKYE